MIIGAWERFDEDDDGSVKNCEVLPIRVRNLSGLEMANSTTPADAN
jgi:hypothetical protein